LKTPEQKYNNDVSYRRLVETIESLIHEARFTPSEVRECATLACIHYEQRKTQGFIIVPENVNESLKIIEDWRVNNVRD